ncbi:hypothetical protein EBA19_25125 [Xanthomonas oryzae pv. oryzae]|nr:hypothetical protein EBA19_25125 [Xanthomonas oryzae pv. oryzae]
MLEPLTAHVTWIVLLAHSWSLHGLNKIVNRFLGALRAAVYGGTCRAVQRPRLPGGCPGVGSSRLDTQTQSRPPMRVQGMTATSPAQGCGMLIRMLWSQR